MVQDQERAITISEMLWTIVQAGKEGLHYLALGDSCVNILLTDIQKSISCILRNIEPDDEAPYLELSTRCKNMLYSLENICAALPRKQDYASMKLEFEFIPLIRIAHARFYFQAQIQGDPARESAFWEQEAMNLTQNEYIAESTRTGEYAYDLSICVTGYNKLDVTKLCLKCLLESIPRTLRCELILVNHGSTDATKEYFEQIYPEKQIDIKINSGDGFLVVPLITEGKYLLAISNDVLLSRNAAEVMYLAMERDPDIAYGVPFTPNISNLQAIPPSAFSYQTVEEFMRVAGEYNHSDPALEEQRTRLLNPLGITKTEYWTNSLRTKITARSYFGDSSFLFGDDRLSLYFRRAGYKLILFRDVFCHHFAGGSSTTDGRAFLEGREKFYQQYGVDAWEKGFCWSYHLFADNNIWNKTDAKRILGINAGMGSDPLKIKEMLKEQARNFNVKLTNYTMEARFLEDLRGVSDEAYYISSWEELFSKEKEKVDYIIVCDGLEQTERYPVYITRLYELLTDGGILIIQSVQKKVIDWMTRTYPTAQVVNGDTRFPCGQAQQLALFQAFCKKCLIQVSSN